jgi:hypothetical protein
LAWLGLAWLGDAGDILPHHILPYFSPDVAGVDQDDCSPGFNQASLYMVELIVAPSTRALALTIMPAANNTSRDISPWVCCVNMEYKKNWTSFFFFVTLPIGHIPKTTQR